MIKNIVDRIADRIRWGYLAAFIILLVSYIISFVATQKLMKQSALANHSNDVIHGLENIVGYVTQGESAARGYIVTNERNLLLKYNSSRNRADSALQNVKALTVDNPNQQRNMDSLRALINDKFSWLDYSISIYDSTHSIHQTVLQGKNIGLAKMKQVEIFTQQVEDEERK